MVSHGPIAGLAVSGSARLRILHITKRYWPFPGGVERYVQDLARAQISVGHEVAVLTIDHDVMSGGGPSLPEREKQGEIAILRVRALGGPRKQFIAEWPARFLNQLRWADVIHHHDPRFAFETTVIAAAFLQRPLIFHTHGMILHTRRYYRLKQFLLRAYYGPLLRHATSAVIAGSEADARMMEQYCRLSRDRLRLYRNAVDLSRYHRMQRLPAPGRILMFGRIDVHKGHARLLELLPRVTANWTLDVVGTGPAELAGALRQKAERLGVAERINWLGPVDDQTLCDLLARSSLALFPSEFEGFGLALLEAMAAGCPVLASPLPTHREILGTDLATHLVDFQNPTTADRISEALTARPEIQHKTSAALRRRAEAFSIERLVNEIEALYGELGLARSATR